MLKIVDGAADDEASDCQVRVLRHLAEQDPALPVPRIQATLQGADLGSVERDGIVYSTLLMGYLPGRLLVETAVDSPLLENIGRTLARVDRALQGFFHPALAQRIAWDVRRLPELAEFISYIESGGVREAVLAVLGAMKQRLPSLRGLRSQAIHGDCHGNNLLIDDATAGCAASWIRRHDSRAGHSGGGGDDVGTAHRRHRSDRSAAGGDRGIRPALGNCRRAAWMPRISRLSSTS